jgi:Pput_2613-like deaminase
VHNDCFSSGKPPHVARVTVQREGEEVFSGTFTSGGMTPEEAALGFPRSSLATHTEARAVRQVPLQAGDEMLIEGSYPPCPSCKGAMNQAARNSGARITYTWDDQIWTTGGKR